MKRVIFLMILMCCLLMGEYYPIIFVHGHESSGDADVAWDTWNDPDKTSAMWKILLENYKGYSPGVENINCYVDTYLPSTDGNTRKIYNFSYYTPDKRKGVIGSGNTPFCIPTYYTSDYMESYQSAQWAKHLAIFINKVLQATGASRVNIVAHSMGGLVARAAAVYYGMANKINKMILIGTPNDEYNEDAFIEAIITNVIKFPQDWQKKGELLELGINYWGPIYGGVLFEHNGQMATWCDWLSWNDPGIVPTVTIGGNRARWWSPPQIFGENDGIVKVSQVHSLSYATL